MNAAMNVKHVFEDDWPGEWGKTTSAKFTNPKLTVGTSSTS